MKTNRESSFSCQVEKGRQPTNLQSSSRQGFLRIMPSLWKNIIKQKHCFLLFLCHNLFPPQKMLQWRIILYLLIIKYVVAGAESIEFIINPNVRSGQLLSRCEELPWIRFPVWNHIEERNFAFMILSSGGIDF